MRVLCDTKLSRPVTVTKLIPRSTGSSIRSLRHSGTPPPPPTGSTVLWRLWNSLLDSPKKKWNVFRSTLHGAYKWGKFLPWVEDPKDILTFLDHHFDLATRGGKNQGKPIQNALRALAYASGPAAIEDLKRFDPTKPSFVRGICYVYQDNKPFELRKAALFFLPLIGDKWFNTPHPIMEPEQMRRLCADWASAVDGIEFTDDVRKATLAVPFGMINSPHWRPHIVPERNGNCWNTSRRFPTILNL